MSGITHDLNGTVCVIFNLKGIEKDSIKYFTTGHRYTAETTIEMCVAPRASFIDSTVPPKSSGISHRGSHILHNLHVCQDHYINPSMCLNGRVSAALIDAAQVARSGQVMGEKTWIRLSFHMREGTIWKGLQLLKDHGAREVIHL